MHEIGICHTSIKSTNIFESDNGGYILSDIGKYYFYNNKTLKEYGFDIPDDLVDRKTPCFEYRDDNRMLGKVLEEYVNNIEIENKEKYDEIIKELIESGNDLDLMKLLHKYSSIFPKPEITIETINNKEFYKLAYFKYPVIDVSIDKYLGIMKNEKDEEVKYYVSVCLLNYVRPILKKILIKLCF